MLECLLLPLGPTTWEQLMREFTPASGWWADLRGWHHFEPLPGATPIATHLWAERTENGPELIRLRLDGPTVVGAALRPLTSGGDGELGGARRVNVEIVEAALWGEDRRIPEFARSSYGSAESATIAVVASPSLSFLVGDVNKWQGPRRDGTA